MGRPIRELIFFVFLTIILQLISCQGEQQVVKKKETMSVNESADQTEQTSFEISGQATLDSFSDTIHTIKYEGCAAAGLLWNPDTNNGDIESFNEYLDVVARSPCKHLFRVVETWNTIPNWPVIATRIKQLKSRLASKKMTYGVFFAESIKYDRQVNGFNFNIMCAPGTKDKFWGQGTCSPDMNNGEYRRYVLHNVKEAVKLGITDFLFGQLVFQDPSSQAANLVADIKNAVSATITIGAQPNHQGATLRPENYHRVFDYLVGPSHLRKTPGADHVSFDYDFLSDDYVAVWQQPWLGNLHQHVIAEIDWSSMEDDVHKLTEMSKSKRNQFLTTTHCEMLKRNSGYIMPIRIPINGGTKNHAKCFGYNKYVFSAANQAQKAPGFEGTPSCQIESAIANAINRSSCSGLTLEEAINEGYRMVLSRNIGSKEALDFYMRKIISEPNYGNEGFAKDLVFSEEFRNQNSSRSNAQFVSFLFERFLGRTVDSASKNFYVEKTKTHGRSQIAAEILMSEESQGRNRWLSR